MRREDLLQLILGHLAGLGARVLCRIGSGFGCLVLGFLVGVIHGSAPFLDTDGFVAPTVERSPLGFPGGHEREGSLDRLNPHYMEAEVTYTAARRVVTVPALAGVGRKASFSRPGRKAVSPVAKVTAPGRRHPASFVSTGPKASVDKGVLRLKPRSTTPVTQSQE